MSGGRITKLMTLLLRGWLLVSVGDIVQSAGDVSASEACPGRLVFLHGIVLVH